MHEKVGIARDDKEGSRHWFAQNYQIFGAPAALFCYGDRRHGPPQWANCGMSLQTVMLLLCEVGLDSCPQGYWARYHGTIGAFLGTPDHQMLFTGMSIG